MAVLVALGIALAAVAFVAAPFFFGAAQASRSETDDEQVSPEMQDLVAEKETVYTAIQELDFDFKSGKLSDEDYRGLRRRHEERAATLLERIDGAQVTTGRAQAHRKTRREKRRG
jgi:hypothetical protein